MKTKLLTLLFIVSFLTINAQEITVNTTMGSGYTDMVYYKLGTETETIFAANSWDIAFLRTSAYEIDIRSNDHNGIEVLEASNNIADWATIDISNQSSWSPLYNSITAWGTGSFSQGSAGYGWGEYNSVTHHVVGSVIFILKYANGDYVKFINEDFFDSYTFKYSKWNGSSWDADVTITIPNTTNPDNRYNYYSFQNENEVVAEPAIADWDFVFTKYWKDLTTQYYLVTGTLHNSSVQVAENIEADSDPLPSSVTYSDEINTIGDDWKTFSGTSFVVNSDKRYYVKYENGTIYRMYFTGFDGISTGNIIFKFEDVTAALGIEDVTDGVSFGMYPNPSKNKKITIVYDVNNASHNEIEIYNINGQQVYKKQLTNSNGFYNQTIDLNNLSNGIYLVKVKSGNNSITKKLVLR